MEYLSFQEIVNAVNGDIIVKGNQFNYTHISTDTRNIDEGSIFIALKGERFNGNDYAVQASNKGAFVCIVDEINFKKEDFKEHTSVIKVKNTRKALLSLAKYYRSKLNIKIVGITGSTGKTSTKDLTAAALGIKYKVFKTQGNFNNEIGLPLMIFKLDNSYDIAVLEMGMSDFGEIHNMAEVAVPNIAMITNIGISHIENLKTRENILKAKLEITDFFDENSMLIVNADNDLLKDLKREDFNLIKTGIEGKRDICAKDICLNENSVDFKVCCREEEVSFHLDVPGKHNVSNALLAIACGKMFNMSLYEIKCGFKNLKTTSMRLDIMKGKNITIINDCYNASPDSMKAAIDVLVNIAGGKKVAVFGTMRELGHKAYEAHREIATYARRKGVDELITLGEFNEAYKEGFTKEKEETSNFSKETIKKVISFDDRDEVVKYLRENTEKKDVILFKASRAMKFENMVEELKKYIF